MFVALDLSIRSTGAAFWSKGRERPSSMTWKLADGQEWSGRAFVRLHKELFKLHQLERIEHLMWEEALPHWAVSGQTSLATLKAAAGLGAHALSFAEVIGARWHETNQSTWRRHFIGKMPRGTKTPDLKAMAMARCRELGFTPQKHDEAEALGLLDYQISLSGITPPWRDRHVLVQQFGGKPLSIREGRL